MKNFASIFSVFCLYFLHAAEAKANTYVSSNEYVQCSEVAQGTEQRLESAPAHFAKSCSVDPEASKWLSWSCISCDEAQIFFSNALLAKFAHVSHLICAKDFYIHTGLSPPHSSLFA